MERGEVADGWGSPAWAGIDPTPRITSASIAWFPRVGGDRPLIVRRVGGEYVVPPRGRG